MKKTVFELLYDEDASKYCIRSEFCPISDQEANPDVLSEQLDRAIEGIVEVLLNLRESDDVSKVIKLITIADICSDIQPYDHIEELWSTMMFDYLPKHERHFRKIKERLGLYAEVNEPHTFNCGGFNIGVSKLS